MLSLALSAERSNATAPAVAPTATGSATGAAAPNVKIVARTANPATTPVVIVPALCVSYLPPQTPSSLSKGLIHAGAVHPSLAEAWWLRTISELVRSVPEQGRH